MDAIIFYLIFRASWKTEPQSCGGILRATSQGQILTSPAYPHNYPGGLECLYIITAEIGKIISLEIEDMELDANKDYILIRDGNQPNSPEIAKLTGVVEENNKIIMSTKNQIYLYFKTNLGDAKRGFKIKYSQGNFFNILLQLSN